MEENKEEIKVIDDKVLPIPMLGKELGRIDGGHFYLSEHEFGMLFHVYNSMDLIIRKNDKLSFEVLQDLVRHKDEYNKLTGNELEIFKANLSAITEVLMCPINAFSDISLMATIAMELVSYRKHLADTLMNLPLQDETPKEDKEFQDAVINWEALKEIISKEVEDIEKK